MISLLISTFAYGEPANEDDPIKLYELFNEDIKIYITQMSDIYEIPKEYVYAIIYNESRFQSDALNTNKNKTKDYGLMQINSSCFKFLKKGIGLVTLDELYSPYTNVNAAFALLNYHYDNTGDNDLMLLRYQVGEGRYENLLNSTEKLPDSFWNTYHVMEEYRQYFEENEV